MLKIAVTGTLASGKSTVTRLIAKNEYPVFSADEEVKKLYKNEKIIKKIRTVFNIVRKKNIKSEIKKIIIKKKNLKKLERLLHPLVRKKMRKFIKLKSNKQVLLFEIPLLVESKLVKYFDLNIFVSSKKKLRVKRYTNKGGNKEIFKILDKRQMNEKKKIKLCHHVITNNDSINVLKKKVSNIID